MAGAVMMTARRRPVFGSATSPLFVDLADEVGTLPMFPTIGDPSPAPAPTRHAPEAPVRCDWPEGGEDDPTECGRPTVAVYTDPAGGSYPRCRRHDTIAARRWAESDGWIRRTLTED